MAADEWVIETPQSTPTATSTAPPQQHGDWVIETAPKQSYIAGLARTALGQGAALGFGDELIAGLRTLGGEKWDAAVADERAKVKQFKAENPKMALGSEIAGSILTPGLGAAAGMAKAATTLGKMGQGVKLGAGYGYAAGLGAGEGDLLARQGNALKGAGIGAALGPVLPAVGATGGALVSKAREVISPTVSRMTSGIEAAADEVIANKLRRSGVAPVEIANDLATGQAASQLPKSKAVLPEVIADADPSLQRLAGSVYRAGGEGGNSVQSFLAARQGGDPKNGLFGKAGAKDAPMNQFERVNDDFARAFAVKGKDLEKAATTIKGEQKVLGNEQYNAAWKAQDAFDQPLAQTLQAWRLKTAAEPGKPEQTALQSAMRLFERTPHDNPQTKTLALAHEKLNDRVALLTQQQAKAAASGKNDVASALERQISQTERQAQIVLDRLQDVHSKLGNQPFAIDTLQRFDAAKRSIDGMISDTKNDNVRRLLVNMKHDLLDAVHGGNRNSPTLNKAYSEARSEWGSREELLNAGKAGRDFMSGRGNVTAQDFKDMTRAEQTMFRRGVVRELRGMMGEKSLGETADFTKLLNKPNVYERLREVMPQGKTSDSMNELISRESRMSRTAAEALGNSKTAQRAQDDLEVAGRDMLGSSWKAFRSSGGIVNMGLDVVAAGAQQAFGFRDDMAKALAKRLIEADPAQQQQILARLAHRVGNDKLDRFLSAIDMTRQPIASGVASDVSRALAEDANSKARRLPAPAR